MTLPSPTSRSIFLFPSVLAINTRLGGNPIQQLAYPACSTEVAIGNVIGPGRKGYIITPVLASLDNQEALARRELASCQMVVELRALDNWEEQMREYLANLRAGLDSLKTPPQNNEEAHEQFEDKRRVVQTLVERININKERKLEIVFKLDVLAALKQLANSNFGEPKEVGIYTRIPDLTNLGRVLVTL